jgi:hypothetical protein
MIVYIVMVNGKIDAVFFNEDLAKNHKRNMTKKSPLVAIVKKEVYDF